MDDTVIDLRGVGKRYRLGEHNGDGADLRERIVGLSRRLRGQARVPIDELWSLRDVSLQVQRGESVGVIGANGSGKSTLLKIVSNITTPSEGTSRTLGRVGSLLEVGAGFHGELTGLENTYLNGAILGMSRREVRRRIDEIVAFAGIEGFMDTPVKRYSSGMYLRLGFAIAAHLEADVLLVDEVLAVGDVEFQRRCLGKMTEIERSGRTVLFVSHDMEAMARLCSRAMWLDHGQVMAEGPTSEVIDTYVRSTDAGGATATFAVDDDKRAQVSRVDIVDGDGCALASFSSWTKAWISLEVVVREPGIGLDVGVTVSTVRGVRLFGETVVESKHAPIDAPGRYRLRAGIPRILMPGSYCVDLWLGDAYETIEWHERVVTFTVATTDRPVSNDRLLGLDVEWSVEREPSG
ncbi:MAG: ABC transporter ATP-binding protein [Ilumatobacteraceae bacterium]